MRNTLSIALAFVLIGPCAAALAGNVAIAPHEAAPQVAPQGAPAAPPIGNSTAYEQAITAYLNNVVKEADQQQPQQAARPAQPAPPPMEGDYPGDGPRGRETSSRVLPRVERITIGIASRAQLETPDGGMLLVSPGDRTPLGEVTAIRASGVWFKPSHSGEAVELADIIPEEEAGPGPNGGKAPLNMGPPTSSSAQIPVPPDLTGSQH